MFGANRLILRLLACGLFLCCFVSLTFLRPEPSRARAIPPALRFRLDSTQSKFIAHGMRGGLFWFKGHEHLVAARDFSGEAVLDPGQITASSLQLIVKTESMAETS